MRLVRVCRAARIMFGKKWWTLLIRKIGTTLANRSIDFLDQNVEWIIFS